MRKQTGELIELLRRAMAHCHKESGIEDIRGSQTRRELAKQLRGMRAVHAKFGTGRFLDALRSTVSYIDGLD